MGAAYMKKLRELARHPEGTQFSQLTREMLTSESWKALCHFPNAMKVVFRLIEEHMAHAGAANGDLICTYNDFEAFGIPRRSIRKAITIAEQLGFIDVLRGRRATAGYDEQTFTLVCLTPILTVKADALLLRLSCKSQRIQLSAADIQPL